MLADDDGASVAHDAQVLRDVGHRQVESGGQVRDRSLPVCEKPHDHDARRVGEHAAELSVSLEDRLAYILERYGKNKEGFCQAIRMNFELCKRVEKKLFKKLTFNPESLADLAENEEIGPA